MGAYSYSGTAASNTTIDGIGSAGSDTPDNIDNLIRTLAASDANTIKDLGGANTVGGSADAITVALADVSTPSYFDGMRFAFRVGTDNATTTPTLNVDSLGTKVIKKTIAGVESDLVAGDLQAGATAEVIYRSAWASAAGAFELLNPLGAERTAAGTLSIEGRVIPSPASQAQYDMLVRGASAWDRLAIGTNGQNLVVRSGTPTWSNVSTFETAVATTSGTAWGFTGIPSWVKEIDVILYAVSLSGTDSLLIQLGDSGGYETSGYSNQSTIYDSTGNYEGTATNGFPILVAAPGRFCDAIISFKNIIGTSWVCSGTYFLTDGSTLFNGTLAGRKDLSSTLDRIQLTVNGSNTGDFGYVNICYR